VEAEQFASTSPATHIGKLALTFSRNRNPALAHSKPPSFVALPPSPMMISRAPRFAHRGNISPTPNVFAAQTSRQCSSAAHPGHSLISSPRFRLTRRRMLQSYHRATVDAACHPIATRVLQMIPPFPPRIRMGAFSISHFAIHREFQPIFSDTSCALSGTLICRVDEEFHRGRLKNLQVICATPRRTAILRFNAVTALQNPRRQPGLPFPSTTSSPALRKFSDAACCLEIRRRLRIGCDHFVANSFNRVHVAKLLNSFLRTWRRRFAVANISAKNLPPCYCSPFLNRSARPVVQP